MITIVTAPPFLCVQDLGWQGYRASGLPPGGAMDRYALSQGNILVGNLPNAAGLEWALGSGSIRFEERSRFAVTGAVAECALNNTPVAAGQAYAAEAGDVLTVGRLRIGRFLYLAFRGGVDVPQVLGARATYLRAGFGGFHGRRLRGGDWVRFLPSDASGAAPGFQIPAELRLGYEDTTLRAVEGPQRRLFDDAVSQEFLEATFVVAAASDRMGYRLDGPAIRPRQTATLPSEPACPGAVQIPDDGSPIVLMMDGPTVGGYPKIAVVISADLPKLAQCTPGRTIRFRLVGLEDAQKIYRRQAVQLHTLRQLTQP